MELSTFPVSDRNSICTDTAHFDVPTPSNGLHHEGQGRVEWGKDQVIGQLTGVVEAATHHEPMAVIEQAMVNHRQDSPIKEPLAFGPVALTEPLPVLWAHGLL